MNTFLAELNQRMIKIEEGHTNIVTWINTVGLQYIKKGQKEQSQERRIVRKIKEEKQIADKEEFTSSVISLAERIIPEQYRAMLKLPQVRGEIEKAIEDNPEGIIEGLTSLSALIRPREQQQQAQAPTQKLGGLPSIVGIENNPDWVKTKGE